MCLVQLCMPCECVKPFLLVSGYHLSKQLLSMCMKLSMQYFCLLFFLLSPTPSVCKCLCVLCKFLCVRASQMNCRQFWVNSMAKHNTDILVASFLFPTIPAIFICEFNHDDAGTTYVEWWVGSERIYKEAGKDGKSN